MNRPSARLLAVVTTSLLIAGSAHAEQYFARLTTNQEVPPVVGAGQGTALVTLTNAGVQFFVTPEGLSGPITACHFHNAAAGVNGPVVRTLTGNLFGNTAMGLWTAGDAEPLTPALIDELRKGNLYINFHTGAHPGGEIRGQVVPCAGVHFTATMTGQQENPALAVAGSGTATCTLSDDNVLFYKVTVSGLTGAITAAHFHTGAIGVNGPVTIAITPSFSGNTATGTVALTSAQRQDFISGRMYVNVHTGANPGGEIRGQVQLAGGFGFSAMLTGANEVPANASPGTATASATLTPSGLQVDLTTSGLSGPITVAHIHNAPAGVNGGVVRTLTGDFVTATTAQTLWRSDDAEPLTPFLVSELMKGNLYINLHTGANPGGEIRGQLVLNQPAASPSATFTATLTKDQEEPATASAALGTGTFRLSPAGLAFNVTVDGLTGPITAGHFHSAAIGVNGGVVRAITGDFVGNTASGTWTAGDAQPLTPALISALLTGSIYVNVHTAANPGGEIRGQVLLASGADLDARLTGSQEVPPLAVAALGTATLTMTTEGVAFAVTVDGLSGAITAAHFHNAAQGVNGPVVRTITGDFTGNTARGVWKSIDAEPLTPALLTELLKGNLYLNVHTGANPGGEIRGQIRLAGGDGRGTVLLSGNEVPANGSPGIGTAAMTLTDQGLAFRVSADALTSALTAAHFHNAPFGVNGPVVRPITADFTNLTADGVWKPSDGSPLTTALIGELVQDNIYMNLHTSNNPGGEIRGQSGVRGTASVDLPHGSGTLRLANAPNPALDRTSFSFFLPSAANVRLELFDLAGRQVATVARGPRAAGWNTASLGTLGLRTGVYMYRLNAGALSETRKMLVMH